MMEILIRNAEGNLTSSDREYAAKKLGRLDRYFNQLNKVELVHREAKRGHTIEVTLFADGYTVRGEEVDNSLTAAIDMVSEKLENRLRRLHKKIVRKHRSKDQKTLNGVDDISSTDSEDDEKVIVLKERHQFLIKPMSTGDAALELELLGYPFYLYRNAENRNIELIFKRKDGTFGLLQPEG